MIGMVVTVLQTENPDGSVRITGVQYNVEVQGVVTGIDAAAQAFASTTARRCCQSLACRALSKSRSPPA